VGLAVGVGVGVAAGGGVGVGVAVGVELLTVTLVVVVAEVPEPMAVMWREWPPLLNVRVSRTPRSPLYLYGAAPSVQRRIPSM
jgi:hypothetical protein